MAKTKNKRNFGLADKVNKKRKADAHKKKLNPFEVHINKEKIKVLGQKSKHDRGLPGVSRAKAIQKRKETLGTEMKLMNKTNAFIDHRIGEKDNQLSAEDRIIARFAAERAKQHTKKNIYNLADDEILTHRGQTLEQIEKFDDPRSDDDEDDDRQKFGGLDDEFVSEGHFGGGVVSKSDTRDGAKSHKDLIEQLVAESKKRKAEKQKQKEETLDLTDKLDTEWKDLQPVVLKRARVENESIIDKLLSQEERKSENYDKTMRELRFEKRGTPSDGLKSQEQQQKEENKKIEQLEKEREARMLGEEDSNNVKVSQSATKHRSAEDLDDNFQLDDEPDYMLAYDKDGNPLIPDHIFQANHVPNGKKQFNDGISDSSSEDGNVEEEESDDEAEEQDNTENAETVNKDGENSSDGSDDNSNDDDVPQNVHEANSDDKESKKDENSKTRLDISLKSKENHIICNDNSSIIDKNCINKKENGLSEKVADDSDEENNSSSGDNDDDKEDIKHRILRYSDEIYRDDNSSTFDKDDVNKKENGLSEEVTDDSDEENNSSSGDDGDDKEDIKQSQTNCNTYDERNSDIEPDSKVAFKIDNFKELLSEKTPVQQSEAIQKLIKSYDPSLAAENKDILSKIFAYLLQHINDTFGNLKTESDVIKAFLVFDKIAPHLYDLAQINKVSTKKFVVEVLKEKHDKFQKHSKIMPDLDTLIFFKLVCLIYPTSDFKHPVTTPSLIFMTEILTLCRFSTAYSISRGLFVTALILEYTILSKRLVPSALNFLRGLLYLTANTSILVQTQVVPPFKLHKDVKLLNIEDDCSKMASENKMAAKDLVLKEIGNDFKVRCLSTCVSMLKEFFDYFNDIEAQSYLFKPHIQLMSRIDLELYPKKLAMKIAKDMTEMKQILETKTFTPLGKEKVRPKALRMYEPDVQEVFTGGKSWKQPKEKVERDKLQHKYKKEMKGALREIRRDKSYIASVKIRQKIQSDNIRKDKVKKIFKDASIQQGELNALKRMK